MAEISVIAKFPFNPTVSITDEITMIQQKTWAPGTDDFAGVVTRTGATAVTVSSFADFLGVIARSPRSSIQKLNVFTHAGANPFVIAFGGNINSQAVGSPDVTLNINTGGLSLIALDSSSLSFLRNGGTFGPDANPSQWNLSSLTDRFATENMVIFFACHTGSDPSLLQDFANTLNVRVIGFTPAVAYCPTYTLSPPAIDRKMDIAFGSCSSRHMTNFHQFSMAANSSQIIFRVPLTTPRPRAENVWPGPGNFRVPGPLGLG
jgi:hypothetical protein